MTKVSRSKVQEMTRFLRPANVCSQGVAPGFGPWTLDLRLLPVVIFAALCFAARPVSAAPPRVLSGLSGMPLCFEANRGQCDEPVDFVARSRDLTVYLTGGDALIALRERD